MNDDFSSADAWRQSLQEKLARCVERLDRVTDGDRRFFDRHKHRNHRLRPAAPVEIEQLLITSGTDEFSAAEAQQSAAAVGKRWFTFIKQHAPGFRLRVTSALPDTIDPDLSEAECKQIFDREFDRLRRAMLRSEGEAEARRGGNQQPRGGAQP